MLNFISILYENLCSSLPCLFFILKTWLNQTCLVGLNGALLILWNRQRPQSPLRVDPRKLRVENDWQLFRVNRFSVPKL